MLAGKIKYQDLQIYEHAHQFLLHVYKLTESFPSHEDKNITSQLRRAVTSLPLNIAEGSGALSFRMYLTFLIFAYRSCQETRACLRICLDLKYITQQQHEEAFAKLDLLTRKLFKYMQYVEGKADALKRQQVYKYHRSDKGKSQLNGV